MKLDVQGPRSWFWVMIALIVAATLVGFAGPVWAIVPVVVLGWGVFILLGLRWRREVQSKIRAVRKPGEPVPYVEVEWPKFADPKFTGLFVAGTLLLLCVFLIVTVIAER